MISKKYHSKPGEKGKSYFIIEKLVSIDKSSQVRLVISKEKLDAEPSIASAPIQICLPRRSFRYVKIDGILRLL
jgi:hypothetical protein